MDAWAIFRRARITLFCFLILTCLSWTALFAVFLYHERSHFSKFQEIIVAGLLSLYGFTAILMYLMVVIQFRLWWEVARLFALLVIHAGSSAVFTIYSPSFRCQSFGTETTCRVFVFTIFVGCWVLCGIILLCFVIALGVTIFFSRSVESSQETEEASPPSTPASFQAGSPVDEPRISSLYSVDSRTGFVAYNKGGESPDSAPSPVNSADGGTITVGPHRFESPNLRHNNNTYGRNMSMRNAPSPTGQTNVISGPRHVDSFHHNRFGNPSRPPSSIYSRASVIRPGVGEKNSSIAENRLNQSSSFPGLKHDHDAFSPFSFHGSPPPVTTPREYTPALYSALGRSVPASPGDREPTYPDRARTATPSIYTSHSSAASVHSMWVEPTLHIPPLPVFNPDSGRFQGPGSYLDPSPGNNAPFATSRSNAPLTPKLSEPNRTMQYSGTLPAHQSYHPPVKKNSSSRRRSNEQVLDQPQWRRLVLNAAAKS